MPHRPHALRRLLTNAGIVDTRSAGIAASALVGANNSKTTGTTLTVSATPANRPLLGDMIVVYCARDDVADDPCTDTLTDPNGNCYVPNHCFTASTSQDGTAANGQIGILWYCLLQSNMDSGSLTWTWTHPSVDARAMEVRHVRISQAGDLATIKEAPRYNQSTAGASAFTTANALVSGDMVMGHWAVESDSTWTTLTGDSDTTDGSWSNITSTGTTGGSADTNQAIVQQEKIVTGTTQQNWGISSNPSSFEGNGQLFHFGLEATRRPYRSHYFGGTNNKSAGTTTSFTYTGTVPTGTLVAVSCVRDDVASDPVTDTFSDGTGNTWTLVSQGSGHSDGTAANGVVHCVFYCVLTTAWSGTMTLTWTHASVTARAMFAEGFTKPSNRTWSIGSASGQSGLGLASCTTASVASDVLVAGYAGVEGDWAATYLASNDNDSTNGRWSFQTPIKGTTGGTANTNVYTFGQYKVVNASGTQTFNINAGVSEESTVIALTLTHT